MVITNNKTLSNKVRPSVHEYFKGKKVKGMGTVSVALLNIFPKLYEVTIETIKKYFTDQELIALLKTGNSYNIIPGSMPVFYHRIDEAIKKGGPKINESVLREKMQSLSLPEAFIVELWICTFLSGDVEAEEYIK